MNAPQASTQSAPPPLDVEAVRQDFPALSPEMGLDKAHEMMAKLGISFSPVYMEGELVGVLDTENISEVIMVNKAVTRS